MERNVRKLVILCRDDDHCVYARQQQQLQQKDARTRLTLLFCETMWMHNAHAATKKNAQGMVVGAVANELFGRKKQNRLGVKNIECYML